MEINDFIEKFVDTIEVEKKEISSTTKFHHLDEWSSLAGLSLIAMVDEEYNVTLKGDEIKKAVTVEDLFNLVQSKI